jgi:hypothetical protein
MSDLSPQARALLDAASAGDDPNDADRARVRAALAVRIGTGAVVGGGIATASSSVGAAVVAAKLVKTLAVVGLVFGASTLRWGDPAPATTEVAPLAPATLEAAFVASERLAAARHAAPTATEEAAAAPDAAAQAPTERAPLPDHARTVAEAPAPALARAPAAPADAPDVAEAPAAAADLDVETALLRRARVAIRNRDVATALSILAQHAAEHPKGQLRHEREALRVLALCRADRADEAKQAAAPFLQGNSPLAARIRESCAGSP